MQKHLTEMIIFLKVLGGGYFFLKHPVCAKRVHTCIFASLLNTHIMSECVSVVNICILMCQYSNLEGSQNPCPENHH